MCRMVKDIEVLHIRTPPIMYHGVFFLGKEIRCDSIKVNRQDNSYILGSHFARIVKIAGKFDSIPSKAREAPFHTGIFRGVLTQTP